MASKKEFNEFMKKTPSKNYWFDLDDTVEVLEEEDPVETIYNKGAAHIYMVLNLRDYPEKPSKIESLLKETNPQLSSLVSHAVENKNEGYLFWEIAKNLPGNRQENFNKIGQNYSEKISKKPSMYDKTTISKDSAQKTIYEEIKQTFPNETYTGISINKESLKV